MSAHELSYKYKLVLGLFSKGGRPKLRKLRINPSTGYAEGVVSTADALRERAYSLSSSPRINSAARKVSVDTRTFGGRLISMSKFYLNDVGGCFEG